MPTNRQQILAEILDQLRAIRSDLDDLKSRTTILESRPVSQLVHQASVEPPDSQSDPPFLIQSITQPATQSITQQSSNSLAKKKRNLKTRLQYKRRNLRVTTVQIQEVEHSLGAWNKPDKHVVLQRMGAWECCWHAAIQSDWMTMVAGTTIEYGVNEMRRLGIG